MIVVPVDEFGADDLTCRVLKMLERDGYIEFPWRLR